MSTPRQPSRKWRVLTPLLAFALALASLGLAAVPADAAARVSVTSSLGTGKANASGATSVNVNGIGLQSIKNAFGGIYVVFGHAENTSSWRPSKGGKTGSDFFYVADSQAKNNQGYQRFVTFPGSSTAESANGGVIGANGSFKLSMVIPGPTFTAEKAAGGTKMIDCREVQCGIFTFGAHGVANGNNETFTPVSFGAAPAIGGTAKEASGSPATNQGGTAQQNPSAAGGSDVTQHPIPAPEGTVNQPGTNQQGIDQLVDEDAGSTGIPQALTNGNPTLGVEQETVGAGRNLGFAGQGFAPGEQVVATLASGVTAAGPIAAGTFGEVAGAAQIPADLTAGTHKLKLTGAGSGTSVEAEFSVMANAATLAQPADTQKDGVWWALVAVIVAGGILLLLVISSLIAAMVRNKKSPRKRRRAKSHKRPATKHRTAAVTAADPALQEDDSWFSATTAADPHDGRYMDGHPIQKPWPGEPVPVTSTISGLPLPSAKEQV